MVVNTHRINLPLNKRCKVPFHFIAWVVIAVICSISIIASLYQTKTSGTFEDSTSYSVGLILNTFQIQAKEDVISAGINHNISYDTKHERSTNSNENTILDFTDSELTNITQDISCSIADHF